MGGLQKQSEWEQADWENFHYNGGKTFSYHNFYTNL